MKKIVIFSGAGVSKESGVETFRDSKDGLWNNYKISEVATPQGWKKNRSKVIQFYNERRKQLPEVQPNDAHKKIAEMEDKHKVTVVTQNVDDLHERGGSTNVLHLHGELTKARGCIYDGKPSSKEFKVYDIGYNDINEGDKCEDTDSQLRPHIVWFEEYPFKVNEAYNAMTEADVLIIVGTSLQIGYTIDLLRSVNNDAKIYYVDPEPSRDLDWYQMNIDYRTKTAVEGITEIYNELMME